jgi:hypothetical protein
MISAVLWVPGAAVAEPADEPISTCIAETQSNDSAVTQCLKERAGRLAKNIHSRFNDRIESARGNKDFFDDASRAEWVQNLRELEAAYFQFQSHDCKPMGMWTVGGPVQRQTYLSCLIQRHLAELARLSAPED